MSTGEAAARWVVWELGGWWEDRFQGSLTIIRQIQGAHCSSITHQVLYDLGAR